MSAINIKLSPFPFKAIRTVFTTILAAVASFKVILFSENDIALFTEVIIFFVVLISYRKTVHNSAKLMNLAPFENGDYARAVKYSLT